MSQEDKYPKNKKDVDKKHLPVHTIIKTKKCFLCSYDICSLFTNVPLAEMIEICSQALYNGDLPEPIIPKHVFTDLMKIATSSVEFSFNICMYRQINGVAMGSLLGPALANIFVEFYESKLFDKISKPQIYYRYVDDTFALFQDEVGSETFLTNLISLHTSLKFTSEKEVNQLLTFLHVLVTKSTNNFTISVYRKATVHLLVNILDGTRLVQRHAKLT